MSIKWIIRFTNLFGSIPFHYDNNTNRIVSTYKDWLFCILIFCVNCGILGLLFTKDIEGGYFNITSSVDNTDRMVLVIEYSVYVLTYGSAFINNLLTYKKQVKLFNNILKMDHHLGGMSADCVRNDKFAVRIIQMICLYHIIFVGIPTILTIQHFDDSMILSRYLWYIYNYIYRCSLMFFLINIVMAIGGRFRIINERLSDVILEESLLLLISHYECLTDMMRSFSDAYGLLIITLCMEHFALFVFETYYLSIMLNYRVYGIWEFIFTFANVIWCIFYFGFLIWLFMQCHRSAAEVSHNLSPNQL